MPPEKERERFDRIAFDFLIADLELGTTLARIAASSGKDIEKQARNVNNARRAYDTVCKLGSRTILTEAQRVEFDDKAASLKSELEKLGEVF